MHHYNHRIRLLIQFIVLGLIFLMLVGCIGSKDSLSISADEKVRLKVLYDSEKWFYSQYGAFAISKFPNMEFDIVMLPWSMEDSDEERKKILLQTIESEQPDVLILTENQFKVISSENVLMDLEVLISQDKDELLSGMVPTVSEYIRSIGSGRLYGLSNAYNSQALYYNKDLFDRAGVAYPRDGMNWEEVLQLAQRFNQAQTGSYGLMMADSSSPFKLALEAGLDKNLRYVDSEGKKVTISSDPWKRVFEAVLPVFHSKSIYVESDDDKPQPGMKYADVLALNPFISGKTAMALVGNYLVNQIRDVQWMDPEQKLNWDMVTLPSDNQATNNINYVWIYNVMAINSKSSNVKAAWQFIKYMNSDEYARISSTSLLNDSLTSRKAYLKDEEGHNYGAFYNLTLSQNDVSWIEKLPRAFHSAFYRAGEDELARVFEGQASLDQALQKLEAEGTRLLTRLQD